MYILLLCSLFAVFVIYTQTGRVSLFPFRQSVSLSLAVAIDRAATTYLSFGPVFRRNNIILYWIRYLCTRSARPRRRVAFVTRNNTYARPADCLIKHIIIGVGRYYILYYTVYRGYYTIIFRCIYPPPPIPYTILIILYYILTTTEYSYSYYYYYYYNVVIKTHLYARTYIG